MAVSETRFFIATNCYRIMECQWFKKKNTACWHYLIKAHPLITVDPRSPAQTAEGGPACWGTTNVGRTELAAG